MCAVIAILLALSEPPVRRGRDEGAPLAPRPGSGQGDESRFFRRREVDFWGTRRRAERPADDLWADSSPPAPVRRLLESPTRVNARAYVTWQKERLERLRRAIAALEEAKLESPDAAREGAPAPILYFSRSGCPYCALQEAELRDLPVTRVPEGSPLWEEYGVTVTPTLVLNGRPFRGLTPRQTLLKELHRE